MDRTVKSFGNGLTAPHDIACAADAQALVYLLAESGGAAAARGAVPRVARCPSACATRADLSSYGRPGHAAARDERDGAHRAGGLEPAGGKRAAGRDAAPARPARARLGPGARGRAPAAGAALRRTPARAGGPGRGRGRAAPPLRQHVHPARRPSCWTRACWSWTSSATTWCTRWGTSRFRRSPNGGASRLLRPAVAPGLRAIPEARVPKYASPPRSREFRAPRPPSLAYYANLWGSATGSAR